MRRLPGLMIFLMLVLLSVFLTRAAEPKLQIVDRSITKDKPPLYGAIYAEPKGSRMISGLGSRTWLVTTDRVSENNGQTWTTFDPKPDFTAGLPYGYRRNPVTSVVDPNTGRLLTIVNSLDTPDLDPKRIEPRIALNTYYLRYRVSEDGGRTWLFDEPIVHAGEYTPERPFDGIQIGKNGFFLGDSGDIPIVTHTGRILVPAQATMLDKDGKLWNPTRQTTFTDVLVIIGDWMDSQRRTDCQSVSPRIEWRASHRVQGDPARSTRGMIEPTLAQFADGRILMVMRGSNAGKASLPSYRWFSISNDDGETWTEPDPWTYDDGTPFFSPSSMSALWKHSSGHIFWVGNVSKTNCKGNSPRWPVVIGEVEPKRLTLVRGSVLEVDTKCPKNNDRGRLDLAHFWVVEDRQTCELVLTYPRSYNSYRSREWATVRIAVK